ncbi:PspC domain-containing protein [Paenibacillus glacialis]|uniref:Phage shock protein PspC N-terminal domain-containing protein n=1 Tax=Paenibacillus glacialis TaxID=494026 RepID=A0A168P289_9BACL|nr:PspC domain-containing protein [Paenibacillus glacialis]OAB46313.1 hypothetical protein PGLA_02740 [Paenibacillus glacialis]
MSRLYRSSRNKMVTGLCGGLAETFGIDATILRVLVAISIPFSGFTTVFIYLVASMVIPKEAVPPFNSYGNGNSNHGAGGHYNNNHYNNADHYKNYNAGYGSEFNNSNSNSNSGGYNNAQKSELDDMMKDIEKKALKKEVEELKIKLSKYEKGEV